MDTVRLFDNEFSHLENALAESTYVAGSTWSLADAAISPYINRLALIGLEQLWEWSRLSIVTWFGGITERPSFDSTITRYFRTAVAERFKLTELVWPEVERVLASE